MHRQRWRISTDRSGVVVALGLMTLGLWGPGQAAEFLCGAGDVACLIAAIQTANANGQANTIVLAAGTYTLTAVVPDYSYPLEYLTFAPLTCTLISDYFALFSASSHEGFSMPSVFSALIAYAVSHFRSHESLRLENMALRHQLAVYQQTVKRPKLRPADRLFWSWLSRLWSDWKEALEFVQPRTVIAWQKRRFRNSWRQLSQSGKPGRPSLAKDVRDLIRDMWRCNPLWGSPRIVGELRKLGITVAKSTVETYRPCVRKPSSPTWKTFLNNHVEDLIACDFFTVPTATFRVLFVFIMLAHERRRIVHFNITEHPTAQWTAQQIVEAFPWETAPRYLLRDREAIYSVAFQQRIKNMGIKEVKIAPRSPWQNSYCERLIGSVRRDVLDHVIVLNDRHLRRVLSAYIAYYHRFRTHLSLEMDCPHPRAVEPPEIGGVMALPEVGGLHHHYERQAA